MYVEKIGQLLFTQMKLATSLILIGLTMAVVGCESKYGSEFEAKQAVKEWMSKGQIYEKEYKTIDALDGSLKWKTNEVNTRHCSPEMSTRQYLCFEDKVGEESNSKVVKRFKY